MRKYIANIFLILVPILVSYIYYYYYAESGDWWSKQCSFHQLTGLHCPGCGGQRAFYYLLHGEFAQSLRSNFLLIAGMPFFIYVYFILGQAYIAGNKSYLKKLNIPSQAGYVIIIVLAIFFVLRNIPLSPFIYLSPPL